MLAKKYRLPVSSVLNQKGLMRRGRYFIVKVFPPARAYSRLSAVVSAKVSPTAAGRNALKRLVYATSRAPLFALPVADYLVIAQKGAYDKAASDGIIKELKNLLTATS